MTLSKTLAEKWWCTLSGGMLCFCANSFLLLYRYPWLWVLWAAAFVAANLLPLYAPLPRHEHRVRVCGHGVKCLGLFLFSTTVTVLAQTVLAFWCLPESWMLWLGSVLLAVGVEAVLFWNGMLCLYATSYQIGVRWRVLGAVCGFVPVVNLFILCRMMRLAGEECRLEVERLHRDAARHDQQVCATRYPLLLVHGVYFRDIKHFNYWGRIPAALERNGARIYYGQHESASSIADSARQLAERIHTIVAETGCEKVNIIAHSKGGLDCRYAMAHLGMVPYIASLITVNTPHRGCMFADFLLDKTSVSFQQKVARTYNAAMRRLGDKHPDFLAAANDLTTLRCTVYDAQMPLPEGVYCRSIGSRQNKATGGRFPLNFTYLLAKYCSGPNDGLVEESSFPWGDNHLQLTIAGERGISHGDMIDLARENIPGFDVREFYIQVVSDLKERGL